MSQTLSIDPVHRIAGGCRAELELDGAAIRRASIGATTWRGIERVIDGVPISDAWLYAQRICGTCAPAHAIASIRAAESASRAEVALDAQLIRNVMICAHAVGEHVATVYQRALPDWISTSAAIAADPVAAAALAHAIAPGTPLSETELRRLQARLRADATRGVTAPFRGDGASTIDPSLALVLLGHAETALEIVRTAGAAIATVAGKLPHVQNLTVGGVATAISLDDPATLNMNRLRSLRAAFERMLELVSDIVLRDVAALAAAAPNAMRPRAAMTVLALPELPSDTRSSAMELPGGVLSSTGRFERVDASGIASLVARMALTADSTWSADAPAEGRYSWARTARLDGRPAEVGAAAQVIVARAASHGRTERWFRELASHMVARSGPVLDTQMLQSPMGRHAARAVRAAVMAELGVAQVDALVANIGRGDLAIRIAPATAAPSGRGVGAHESPHGALVHTLQASDGAVGGYAVIAPDNWNVGPRAGDGSAGPCESALVGVTLDDAARPVEALRTIHSFAPCMTCASA